MRPKPNLNHERFYLGVVKSQPGCACILENFDPNPDSIGKWNGPGCSKYRWTQYRLCSTKSGAFLINIATIFYRNFIRIQSGIFRYPKTEKGFKLNL